MAVTRRITRRLFRVCHCRAAKQRGNNEGRRTGLESNEEINANNGARTDNGHRGAKWHGHPTSRTAGSPVSTRHVPVHQRSDIPTSGVFEKPAAESLLGLVRRLRRRQRRSQDAKGRCGLQQR